MDLTSIEKKIKQHPDFHKAGMILFHNGVVRKTSRQGEKVTGLEVAVDYDKLDQIINDKKKDPGIIDILIYINDGKRLAVGDNVMFIAVAGDIRDNVIKTLTDTLNLVKSEVTTKKQYFV